MERGFRLSLRVLVVCCFALTLRAFVLLAAPAAASGVLEAARMRSGIFQGLPAREFSGSVFLREDAYVLRCDTLLLYNDTSWEAKGSLSVEFPGLRIDAESARRGRVSAGGGEGLALQKGRAYFYSGLLRIDFARCTLREPTHFVYEEARLFLEQWGEERLFPTLAVRMKDGQLLLELPQEKLYIDNVLTKYIPGLTDAGRENGEDGR